jgi:hypothetical protein
MEYLFALPWQQWLHECASVCTLRVLLDLWLPRFGSVLETDDIHLVTYSPDVITVWVLYLYHIHLYSDEYAHALYACTLASCFHRSEFVICISFWSENLVQSLHHFFPNFVLQFIITFCLQLQSLLLNNYIVSSCSL